MTISSTDSSTLNVRDIQRRFDRAASHFDTADFVHAAARDGMFARLQPMRVEAQTVVDLGSATGTATRLLSKQFRRAQILSVDLSHNMLQLGRRKQSWLSRTTPIQCNALALPFADQSVDFVFSNLLLPWSDNPLALFTEVARVLKKDGLLMFSTLGPDSLLELRRAWQAVDDRAHVNRYLDMHDVGDAAVRAGLRDPVLDVDRLNVTFENAQALFRDLTLMGARNCLKERNPALVGKALFSAVIQALDKGRKNGRLNLNLELVYGHCWGGGPRVSAGDYRVDANRIGRRAR